MEHLVYSVPFFLCEREVGGAEWCAVLSHSVAHTPSLCHCWSASPVPFTSKQGSAKEGKDFPLSLLLEVFLGVF